MSSFCSTYSHSLAGAAEKRDWAWVDASELVERVVEGGSCRVRSKDGQRLILLPRLGVTLRTYLQHILMCIQSKTPCNDILLVPLGTASRCLHVFGVHASFTEIRVKDAFATVSLLRSARFAPGLRVFTEQMFNYCADSALCGFRAAEIIPCSCLNAFPVMTGAREYDCIFIFVYSGRDSDCLQGQDWAIECIYSFPHC